MRGQLKGSDVLDYILAGNATFTVENSETGNRFTFKITSLERAIGKKADKELWFVKLLNGANNESDYMFLGSLQKTENTLVYKHSKKSHATEQAVSVKAIAWMIKRLQSTLAMPENVHVWHEGRCGRCGRKLTVPESIESGYGPECIKIAGM